MHVGLDQPETDIAVKLLTTLIQHQAWAAFDVHLLRFLIIGGERGKCPARLNALFDGANIDAKLGRNFTLHIETGNVAALFEKGAAERPHRPIESAGRLLPRCQIAFAELYGFQERMRAHRGRRSRVQPKIRLRHAGT